MHNEHEAQRRQAEQSQAERERGLLDLLRRMVGSRPPEVLVMERDGQLRRADGRPQRD